jgi:hypothetical protein
MSRIEEFYRRIDKRSSLYEYTPPSDFITQIYDFYLLTSFYNTGNAAWKNNEETALIYKESLEKITDILQKELSQLLNSALTRQVDEVLFDASKEQFITEITNPVLREDNMFSPEVKTKIQNHRKELSSFESEEGVLDRIVQIAGLTEDEKESIYARFFNFDKVWEGIYQTVKNLNSAASLKDKIFWIDRAIDLQHHTGSIFMYAFDEEELEEVETALDFKAEATLWELYEHSSTSLQPFVSNLIYKTLDDTYEQQNLRDPKQLRKVDPNKAKQQQIPDQQIAEYIVKDVIRLLQTTINSDQQITEEIIQQLYVKLEEARTYNIDNVEQIEEALEKIDQGELEEALMILQLYQFKF